VQEHLVAPFLNWAEAHSAWAPAIVFLLAFIESLPVIGLAVPGTALLLGIGMLIALDLLPALPTVLAAIVGAALGDSFGYAVARRMGPRLVRRYLPVRWRRAYARALLMFRRWGWWAVFASRFFAPLRAFVPVIAGLSAMTALRFQTANVTSAVIWALLLLMPALLAEWAATLLPRNVDVAWLAAGGLALLASGLFAAWWRRRAGPT
jgi:membrane protein DedA with SNARE-associated domain